MASPTGDYPRPVWQRLRPRARSPRKAWGSRVTEECLGSPLPPAHPQGFTLGQLEPEVAFKQLDGALGTCKSNCLKSS